jgi:competence protein ComEA
VPLRIARVFPKKYWISALKTGFAGVGLELSPQQATARSQGGIGVREPAPQSLFEPAESDPTAASDPLQAADGEMADAQDDRRRRWIRTSAVGTIVLLSVAIGYALHRPALPSSSQRTQFENAATGSSAIVAPDHGSPTVQIVVDVHGDVKHPGVYRLPVNARVQDAVAAAGGYNHPEDAALVNAAAILDDGAEVVIPSAANGTAGAPASAAPTNQGSDASVVNGNKVDINTATPQTLETLPGIGPSKAEAIVRYRTDHGPFHTANDLLQVPGIGQATVARLAPYLDFSSQH